MTKVQYKDIQLPVEQKERAHLMNKVFEKSIIDAGCVRWTGFMLKTGYGSFSYKGKPLRAHRLSAKLAGMEIEGKEICHTCDNRWCINPEHLIPANREHNMRDAVLKKRQNTTILSAKNVRDIRHRLKEGETQISIAKSYGVCKSTVGKISSNKNWHWLK